MRKVVTISLSIPAGLVERLREEAGAVGVSMSSLATIMLYQRYKTDAATAYGLTANKADAEEV
jgi:hypothetical protein